MPGPSSVLHAIEFPVLRRLRRRQVTVRGWCFDSSGALLRGIRARVGEKVFVGKRKQARPFIGRRFPELAEAAQSGFTIDIKLPRGTSEVIVECKTDDGKWRELEKLSFETPRFLWPWQRTGEDHDYDAWVRNFDTLTPQDKAAALDEMAAFSVRPRFSILLPTWNTPEKWLRRALDSVLEQWYPDWELCVADDASTAKHVRRVLEEYAARDPRIRLAFRESNGHIVAATNTALESARGDFVIHFDHDDELRPHALFCVAREIAAHPEVDLLYSDEDHLDEAGRRYDPYFKPDFNYDLLLSQNVICHLGAYRTALVREVGGFRPGTEGAQDWDLALRVVAASRPERIRHIPRILYHWRSIPGSTARGVQEKPYTVEAGRAAVQAHLEQTGQAFDAVTVTPSGRVRIQWSLPDPAPPVTIIIPTRNFAHLLRICVESVLAKTDYRRFEILIVDNDSDEPETLSYLAGLADEPRIRVLPVPGPFNYSLLNNRAVEATPHPVLCLLNNDIEILDGGWLREMVSQAIRPEVGAVGARLYYPDGRIQHDGVILGVQGCAGHFNKLLSPSEPGPKSHSDLTRNFSAVTAACLVVERSKYLEVRGLDEGTFAVAFNDVDFCLKLFAAGYRNLRTPFAELIHHESASRGEAEKTQAGLKRAMKETISLDAKWHDLLEFDPAYNPNLTLSDEDGSIAFPPRLEAAKLAFAPAQ